MADINLTSAPVTWLVANQIEGSRAWGASGYVEFEASTVAAFQGGLTWLPSPQRAEMVDGEMTPIDLPINDPEIWNWKVTPHLGVHWEPFHINVDEGGADLSSAAIVPGKGPVRVLQGPQGGSVVGAEDQGDGTIRFVLDDGTRTKPMPITRGPAGPANQIEIGTVLRGDEPYASLTGVAPEQRLNLTLPKGDPGNPEDLNDATPKRRGLMSAADKTHLDQSLTAEQIIETNSIATSFDNLEPRYAMSLDVRGNNIMQAFGRDSRGRWYVTQVYGTSGAMSVNRCDAGGNVIDSMVLNGGGHGGPWGFEEVNGDVYMWIWWTSTTGDSGAFRRWKYTPGDSINRDDPSVETVPDFVSSTPGFQYINTSINQPLDLMVIGIRVTTDRSWDILQLRRFSEYKAGIDNVIATLPPIGLTENGAFQGLTATWDHAYILRGMSGEWPQSPHLDMYRWSDGARLHTKHLDHLPFSGHNTGQKAEAEGMIPIWDNAGRMGLMFGIPSGANGANVAHIYSLTPTDYQNDPGVGRALQRVFSPLYWEDVPLMDGFSSRGDGYSLQVARDTHGMVHLRGHMSSQGFTNLSSPVTFARLKIAYRPAVEVRWLGYRTGLGSSPLSGYISASSGDIVLQADPSSTVDFPTGVHFALIVQPWQAKA